MEQTTRLVLEGKPGHDIWIGDARVKFDRPVKVTIEAPQSTPITRAKLLDKKVA